MRKIYSIVLMATALLIGANMQAGSVSTWDDLKTALQAGREVTLSADINVTADNVATWRGIWIGSESVDGTAPTAVLDLNGHNIIINSGNYQSKGVTQEQALNPFAITKGSLTIKSATPAKIQVVKGQSIVSKSTNVFSVFGADDANKVDPKGNNPFTYLEIGANVTVETQNGTVVAIDALKVGHAAVGSNTNYTTYPTGKTSGFAYGARIEIEGTLISQGAESTTISTDKKTGLKSYQNKCYGIKVNGLVLSPADENKKYAPYVHIHPSAVLQSDNRSGFIGEVAIMAGSAAVYASGFAQWLIEGNCSGATGVYIGSGIVAINDAQVKSAADVYDAAGAGGHANGSGSAIVVNSRSNYQGEVELTISGDTKAESTSGYALEEVVNTTNNETKVEKINIQGGTFEGGAQGALVVTPATTTEATVNVTGGSVEGTGNIGTDDLATYLNNQGGTHTTLVKDESGKTILVISEGAAPVAANSVIAQNDGASIKWITNGTATENMKDIAGGKKSLTLNELEINDPTYVQTLIIADGYTLTAKRVVLGANARIVVEAGAKFIVTGEQGIIAPSVENIILKNEGALLAADRKHATFLFNPAVTSNRHPNATVELTTYSFRNSSSDYQWERFGVPTHNAITSISSDATVPTAFSAFIDGTWQSLGYLNYPGHPEVNPADFNKPFVTYEMMANRTIDHAAPAIGPKYQFAGELVGNDNASLNVYAYWTPFTNSYVADIDLAAMLNTVKAANIIDEFVYVALPGGLGSYNWDAVDEDDAAGKKLAPMQAFILKKTYGSTETESIDLNYNSMVYLPATSTPNPAPRRSLSNDYSARLRVVVENEQGVWDNVKLRETATRTKEAEKYLNDDVNIYAMGGEKAAILATEDLENTYVGFSTVKGGKFTISFANVEGREFVLVDHETGAQVAMVEGATYEFTAEANSVNDYRFEIVSAAKMPTAIENAEAVKSAKGIYTITGQYVGEMNVWNTLPAGIYVVNGEKLVK